MREVNLGPVANPDGSPTALTRAMLAGTGRDADAFAASAKFVADMIDGALNEARSDVREYVTDSVGMQDLAADEGDRLLAVIEAAVGKAREAAQAAYGAAPDDGQLAYIAALDAAHGVFDPLLPDLG